MCRKGPSGSAPPAGQVQGPWKSQAAAAPGKPRATPALPERGGQDVCGSPWASEPQPRSSAPAAQGSCWGDRASGTWIWGPQICEPSCHPLLNASTGQRQGSGREHTLHSPFKPGDFIPEGLGTLTALAYFLLWVRRWRTCWRLALDFDFVVLSSVLQSSHRTLAHFQGEVGKSSQNDAPQ